MRGPHGEPARHDARALLPELRDEPRRRRRHRRPRARCRRRRTCARRAALRLGGIAAHGIRRGPATAGSRHRGGPHKRSMERQNHETTASASTSAGRSPTARSCDGDHVTIGKAPSTPPDFARGFIDCACGRGAGRARDRARELLGETAACRTGRPSASTPSSAGPARASGLIATAGHGDALRILQQHRPHERAAGRGDPQLRRELAARALRPARRTWSRCRADRRVRRRRRRRSTRSRSSRASTGCSARASRRSRSATCGATSTRSTRTAPGAARRALPRHLHQLRRTARAAHRRVPARRDRGDELLHRPADARLRHAADRRAAASAGTATGCCSHSATAA